MIAENEKMAAELRLAITDSTTIIYPDGKVGGDAYWNLEQMIEQVGCLFLAQDLISLSCNCSSSLLSSLLVASFPRPSFIGSLITRLHMAVLLKMP
jgi:hypothetical protein